MQEHKSSYVKFAAMILTSMVVMFGIKYLNTYDLSHLYWSETRFYMTFMMGGAMAIVMLAFMLSMYKNTKLNLAIFAGSAVVFFVALWLVRSQETIGDESWMSAMIPHHSIAILTSERAYIQDVRVRELADAIIEAQRKEIKEMEWLLEDIDANGLARTEAEAAARPVPEFEGVVAPDDPTVP
ncbi:DUF305 domain-containing protein [Maricaulis sp. CAU 1757]